MKHKELQSILIDFRDNEGKYPLDKTIERIELLLKIKLTKEDAKPSAAKDN